MTRRPLEWMVALTFSMAACGPDHALVEIEFSAAELALRMGTPTHLGHRGQQELIGKDLSLQVKMLEISHDRLNYELSLTNVGTVTVNLEGPTSSIYDNVGFQTYLSANGEDLEQPAGGALLYNPGQLAPGEVLRRNWYSTSWDADLGLPYFVVYLLNHTDTNAANDRFALDVVSTVDLDPSTGIVTIVGTPVDDVATAAETQPGTLTVSINTNIFTYATSVVQEIHFFGNGGDDLYGNNSPLVTRAWGGNGDDRLTGGPGGDLLEGGSGNDILLGNSGHDTLRGGEGDDYVRGGDRGDRLFGGPGNDLLIGDRGHDILVAIGDGVDYVWGGGHWDFIWVDSADVIRDASANELALGYVHVVEQYHPLMDNAADTYHPVGLDPNGEDLIDPVHYSSSNLSLVNFSDRPLFADAGPTMNDIDQNSVGDCYLMSRLGALAGADPHFIRKTVVDLDDGTYAVRFYDDGQERFVRVDADLWVRSNGDLWTAGLGQDDSLWVAIIEKAYAFYRRRGQRLSDGNGGTVPYDGSYWSIYGGSARVEAANFNTNRIEWWIEDGIQPQAVVDWVDGGSPLDDPADVAMADQIETSVAELLTWIMEQQAAGKGIISGAMPPIHDNMPIRLADPSTGHNDSTYRRGRHIYMVHHVLTDGGGAPIGIAFRDPTSANSLQVLTDFTRIHFCIGRAYVIEPVYVGSAMLP